MNPKTETESIRELRAANDDLRAENARMRAIIDATLSALPVGNVRTHTPDSIPERVADLVKAHADELAENEQLRKDKARLDWLDRNALLRQRTLAIMERDGDVLRWAGVEWSGEPDDTLRAVIDAAMKGDK